MIKTTNILSHVQLNTIMLLATYLTYIRLHAIPPYLCKTLSLTLTGESDCSTDVLIINLGPPALKSVQGDEVILVL